MLHSNRRSFIRNSAFLLGGMSLSPQDQMLRILFPDPGKITELRGGVAFYTERGGTIGLYRNDDTVVVVDTQFPEQAGNLLSTLQQHEDFDGISLLVNTHHHGDHTAGNIAFQDVVKRHVAHENSRIWQEKSAQERNTEDQQLYPAITYTERWSILLGGERVTLHHFGPGHTGGDSLVHFENANVVHCGDLMFNRRIPNVDRPSGASMHNWIKVLKKARRTFDKDTIYIFGHAAENYPVSGDCHDLKAMENYLKAVLRYVKKEKRRGATLEQLKEKTTSIPGAPEYSGDRFLHVNLEVAWAEVG